MGKRSDTDKAIRNIMNWADQPAWAADKKAAFDAHLDPICERIGMSQEELGQELTDQGYGGMVLGAVFEDFLSARLPPEDRNIIDDYLSRRGWRESPSGRRYLLQLRDSVLSLYEVIEVKPGHYCVLRDLVRGGKPIRVHEHMGTQDMVKWDRVAARVLNTNDKHIFSGGILPFPQDMAQSLLSVLDKSRKRFNKDLTRMAGKEAAAKVFELEDLDEQFLRSAATAFTAVWLMHTLERLNAPLPEMVNRDGEALMFTETRFPVLEGQFEKIAQSLDADTAWERDGSDGGHTWLWFPEPEDDDNKPQQGITIETFQGGQRPISGTLELKPGRLTLTSNSTERAERATRELEILLHGRIGPALSKLQTPEQLIAGREPLDDTDSAHSDSVDPEIAAEIIHTMMDQHYRRCLDEPVPALGNKTPRQCAKSKRGREKVIDWLKHLENSEQRRAASQGQAPYDTSWMWEELKLK